MGMPTVLIYLITIYDDEEGSKSSHITPLPITQEEELEETSAPTYDELVPNPQEGDLKARNTLVHLFINQIRTYPKDDNSKNDLDTGEQE